MELKRFLILRKERTVDGNECMVWIATVYAERFVPTGQRDSFTGHESANFFIGDQVVGSVDLCEQNLVTDSGGRMQWSQAA